MIRKVLCFINPTGLMDRDMTRGFTKAGFDVLEETLQFAKTPEGHTVQMFSTGRVLEILDRFKPDLVFSFNGFGADDEGFLAEAYAKRGIPFASWFVDLPKAINIGKDLAPHNSHLFVFDSAHMDCLTALGFEHVYHLPLATDPDRFRPLDHVKPENRLCFVGESDYKTIQYLAKTLDRQISGTPDQFYTAVEAAVESQRQLPGVPTDRVLLEAFRQYGQPMNGFPAMFADLLESFVEREASLRHRLEFIEALQNRFGIVVHGDRLWTQVVGNNNLGKVNYFSDDVVVVYNRYSVHINISKFQLCRAINQRPFDIAACGGFVLTDEREELRLLFSPEEVVSYSSLPDLQDKADYYLSHHAERKIVARNARARILADHTYANRAARVVQEIS